jgi:hypothetical protein
LLIYYAVLTAVSASPFPILELRRPESTASVRKRVPPPPENSI